jgi:hypothetical protein
VCHEQREKGQGKERAIAPVEFELDPFGITPVGLDSD